MSELMKGLEASASIYNPFDQRHPAPTSPDVTQQFVQPDGRSFQVKLDCHF